MVPECYGTQAIWYHRATVLLRPFVPEAYGTQGYRPLPYRTCTLPSLQVVEAHRKKERQTVRNLRGSPTTLARVHELFDNESVCRKNLCAAACPEAAHLSHPRLFSAPSWWLRAASASGSSPSSPLWTRYGGSALLIFDL